MFLVIKVQIDKLISPSIRDLSLQLVRSGNSQRYKMCCFRWHKNLPILSGINGLVGQSINYDSNRELLHSFVIDGKWQKKVGYLSRKAFTSSTGTNAIRLPTHRKK